VGVVGPGTDLRHLALEESDSPLEHRAECDTSSPAWRPTLERFAPNQANESRAFREEAEPVVRTRSTCSQPSRGRFIASPTRSSQSVNQASSTSRYKASSRGNDAAGSGA